MAAPLGGSIAVNSFVDSAGPNQPFFAPASGGGGGGVPANINVSSLYVAPSGQLTMGTDSGGNEANLFFATTADNQNGIFLQYRNAEGSEYATPDNKVLGIGNSAGANPPTTAPIFVNGINFRTGYTNVAQGTIGVGDGGLALTNVSTINGQAPGGGSVPPNLSVSSIQALNVSDDLFFVGGGGTIIFDQQGDQNIKLNNGNMSAEVGTRVLGGNTWLSIGGPVAGSVIPVSISSLTCAGSEFGNIAVSTLSVSSINGAQPGGGGGPPPAVVSTISSFVNVSTINYGSPGIINVAGGMQVADFLGAGTISTVRVDSIVPGGAVAIPLAALSTVVGDVNVSSLTGVSSINGAAYPPASGGMMFSSIGIPGGPGSAFNADPNVITNVLTIPIIPNHVYSFDVNARVIANNAPAVTDTDNYYLEIVANGGSTVALDTAWGVQVSSLTSGSIYTEVGGSGILKAPANPVSTLLLNILGSFSTTTRVDSFSYIDFGAI